MAVPTKKKKLTLEDVPSTNRLARRSTNRERTRNRRYWEKLPATGPIKGVLEKHIEEMRDDERIRVSPSGVVADAAEFVEEPDDYALCAKHGLPVTVRHMEYVQAHLDELKALGVEELKRGGKTEVVAEDAAVAMRDVVQARNVLAEWAGASGQPRRDYDIRRHLGSPSALYNRVLRIVEAAEDNVDELANPAAARKLIANLRDANEVLAEVAGFRTALVRHKSKTDKRKRLLVRNLYEVLIWMSGWGRTLHAIQPDQELLRRWSMDKTFPNQKKNETGSLTDAVARAIRDPSDVG
jgi:hypothetical protein